MIAATITALEHYQATGDADGAMALFRSGTTSLATILDDAKEAGR